MVYLLETDVDSSRSKYSVTGPQRVLLCLNYCLFFLQDNFSLLAFFKPTFIFLTPQKNHSPDNGPRFSSCALDM